MACGIAVKRSRDVDLLLESELSGKRRRTTSNAANCGAAYQSFNQYSPNHHFAHSNVEAGEADLDTPSPFGTSVELKNPPDELDAHLLSQIEMIQRRRMIRGQRRSESPSSSDSDSEQRMDSSSGNIFAQGFPQNQFFTQQPSTSAAAGIRKEKPMFTYKQVRMICERLLREQERRIREEYDQTLNAKLAEQYDTFVRFTYDQIHRRIEEAPASYLS